MIDKVISFHCDLFVFAVQGRDVVIQGSYVGNGPVHFHRDTVHHQGCAEKLSAYLGGRLVILELYDGVGHQRHLIGVVHGCLGRSVSQLSHQVHHLLGWRGQGSTAVWR